MVAAATESLNRVLPYPRTRRIGRVAEIAQGRAFLLDDAAPLLTLTGPGGVGKTRLALAIAHDVAESFADGVAWVDLAPLAGSALVPGALASTFEIVPAPDQPVADALVHHLRQRQTLLLLDNCEHLVEGVAEIAALLLNACPALQILATSRAPLRVRGEQEFPIEPLPLPPPGVESLESFEQNEAVRLFIDRARAVCPGFALTQANAPSVAAICQRVDGLPLAIELAAARSKILSPAALLAQMTDRLRVLDSGQRDLPPRQRTMRDAIAWSYDLLDGEAGALFRRLAVFAGGFDAEAAAAIHGGDLLLTADQLTVLADHSLIQGDTLSGSESDAGAPRFRMLETIRQFGLEVLAGGGEHGAARDAHAAYFLALAERAEGQLFGGPEERRYLDLLEVNHDNFRAAFEWFDERGNAERLLRFGGALWEFWGVRGHQIEGRQRLQRALALGEEAPEHLRMAAMRGLAAIELGLGHFPEVVRLLETTLAVDSRLGDKGGMAHAHRMLGLVALAERDLDQAAQQLERSLVLYRDIQERGGCLWCHRRPWCAGSMTAVLLGEVAAVAGQRGEYERSRTLVDEALPLLRQMNDQVGIAMVLRRQAESERRRGDVAQAESCLLESLAIYRELGMNQGIASVLRAQAACARDQGASERALTLLREAQRVSERIGDEAGVAAALDAQRDPALDSPTSNERSPRLGVPIAFTLTRREQEILALLCQRLTNPEIAAHLYISPMTARNHVANILSKLGAANRREAAAIAAREGLV